MRGTAFGVDGGTERQDVIIDPMTGDYIGQRQILIEPWDGIPSGTVMGFTSVSAAVANAIGEKPAG